MVFTDDDLQRLKAADKQLRNHAKGISFDWHDLKAFVTRLECAEKDRDYWKARCVSAEESVSEDHLAKVRSGLFSKCKAAGK